MTRTARQYLGVERWLLSSTENVDKVREDWERDGITYLRCGELFTAVRIPGVFVHAAARSREPEKVDDFLLQALEGGPVIASVGLSRYYALVPSSAPTVPLEHGTECLPDDLELGVPPLTLVSYEQGVSYWAVPLRSAGELCDIDLVDRLVHCGQTAWSER